jgi:hypothetical protein
MFRRFDRLLALVLCAALAPAMGACAGSMQSASTASGVVKRPVRASKGSVEKSARK